MADIFPIFDDGPGLIKMVRLANHLAEREAEMPLRRRMQSWLKATARNATSD